MSFIKSSVLFSAIALATIPAVAQGVSAVSEEKPMSLRHRSSQGGFILTAEYYNAVKQASLKNKAGSILNWRDLDLNMAQVGAEYKGYGFTVFGGGNGPYGYMTDDDIYNKLYQISNGDVKARYYGLDAYKRIIEEEKFSVKGGISFSRLETDSYPRFMISYDEAAGSGAVNIFDPRAPKAMQIYNFNNAYGYIGADVSLAEDKNFIIRLSSQIGVGFGMNQLDWRNEEGESGMRVNSVISPMIMFRTELGGEWWFVESMALTLNAGYKAEEMLGTDTSTVTIDKSNMSPSDPRIDMPEEQVGSTLESLSLSEIYGRIGLKIRI